jgi:protein-tyrosine phosphatase
VSGYVDLHCHLLWGVDDGAKTVEDALEMARALVDVGFSTVAASPHNRPEYAPRTVAEARLLEARQALAMAKIPLSLERNAENFFLDERLLDSIGTPSGRPLGAGAYLLVEAPYTSPLPSLTDLIFRMKLKGVTPLIAHPERCMEFERESRAREAVQAGAHLQLDVGALVGRYGPRAKKLARAFLDDGLYSVAASDLHSPVGARDWVGRSISELKARAGEKAAQALLRENPAKLLAGEDLES